MSPLTSTDLAQPQATRGQPPSPSVRVVSNQLQVFTGFSPYGPHLPKAARSYISKLQRKQKVKSMRNTQLNPHNGKMLITPKVNTIIVATRILLITPQITSYANLYPSRSAPPRPFFPLLPLVHIMSSSRYARIV